MVSVSAVVVTWNSASMILACLDALRAQTLPVAEIVVVDNGSDDGTVSILRDQPDLTLIANQQNLGFAAANNQGLRLCIGELVLLLNHDVELAPDYLERCSRHFSRGDVGSITGKLLRPGGDILDSTGHNVYRVGWAENRGELEADRGFDSAEEVFGVCAAAALYRRNALDSVAIGQQVLDESYFSYIEDVDLDWRLRWMGWRAWYEPGAVAVHFRSASGARFSTAIMRHIIKNRLLTVVKNYDSRWLWRFAPGIAVFTLVKTVDFGRRKPGALVGLLDFARLLPDVTRKRRKLRAMRIAPEDEMRRWLLPFPWRSRIRRRVA